MNVLLIPEDMGSLQTPLVSKNAGRSKLLSLFAPAQASAPPPELSTLSNVTQQGWGAEGSQGLEVTRLLGLRLPQLQQTRPESGHG